MESGWPISADNDDSPLATGGNIYTLSLYTQYGLQLVQQQHPR